MCSAPTEPRQRLFFALWPPEMVRAAMHTATTPLIAGLGRPVAWEDLHITLAFIGSVPTSVRDCVQSVAGNVQASPFELVLEQIGHWRRPQVLWLGPDKVPDALTAFTTALYARLADCGCVPETREFRPHVTLARKVGGMVAPRRIAPIPWRVDSFALVESVTAAEGARYQVLKQWSFSAK